MTTVLKIIVMCCLAQSLLAILQANTCKIRQDGKPTDCSRVFGFLGCVVIFTAIWHLFKKK